MNVLMIGRKTLFSSPGGDTIQIRMTAAYLNKLGAQVDIRLTNEQIDYSRYDLLHFFNIIRPDDILPHISKSQVPFVVSTIFVDYSEFEQKNRKGIQKTATTLFDADKLEYLKAIARSIKNGDKIRSPFFLLNGQRAAVRHIAQKAALLLPNSHNEYQRFKTRYQIKKRYKKVPNAIDVHIFNPDTKPDERFSGHVLCVARFEGLKNQLNLIKALDGTNLHLTLIGKPAPNHLRFYEECKNAAAQNENVQIIEQINQKELASIYKAAKVHVLPSWFETTGLSSLEAGVMGCNIVVSRKGDTEEYFEDMAWYCEPDSVASIRESVLQAYNAPVTPRLKERILKVYTWQNTAEETFNAYEAVLNRIEHK